MSKANWALVNPSSGSGNKTVSVSSESPHTGRVARSTTLTITAADCEPCLVTVNQAGKPEFVENASDTATAAKAGQVVTIRGKSNSKKLNFSIGASGNTLHLEAPATYTAASISTPNNTDIEGDPGKSAEYDWSVQFVIPKNDTVDSKSAQIIVTDGAGNQDTCTLTQSAGDARLEVSKTSVDLSWEGTPAASFDVTSNTTWAIS